TALANLASLAVARIEAAAGAPLRPRDRLEDEVRRRHEAEQRFEEEREFSAAVLENLTGGFYLVAADGRMLRWNPAFAAAVGYSDAEIGAMRPEDFISPHDRPAVAEAMRAVLEQTREMALETEIVDRAGNIRPY